MNIIKENISLAILLTLVMCSPLAFLSPLIINNSIIMENTYTTTLKRDQADIHNQPKGYDEFQVSNCTIHWELTVESRKWGIKSISCIIKRIELTVNKVVYAEGGDDDESQEEFVITPDDWTINTEFEVGMIPDQIHPVHIEFDWDTKVIEILIG